MKNEHQNRLAFFITRVALLAIAPVLLCCAKEDLAPQGTEQFLYDKQWRLESRTVTERDREVPELIPACRQDDALVFVADKTLLNHYGQNKCGNEPDVDSGVWSLDAENKILTLFGEPYQVIGLSATRMELQRERRGVNGTVIVKSFYVAE
jgi:hypothetical protein